MIDARKVLVNGQLWIGKVPFAKAIAGSDESVVSGLNTPAAAAKP